MNNKVDHDQIKQYAVQIEYAEEKASGVIVKPCDNSSVYYVFTAKHTFKADESGTDLSEIEIDLEKVVVNYFFNEKTSLKLSTQLDLTEYESDDLVVFVLESNENNFLKNIPSFNIVEIVENDFTNCSIIGYPTIRKEYEGEQEYYPCRYEKTNEEGIKYEVLSEKSLHSYDNSEINSISGLSGGGVFTQFNGKEYLVGIQIQIRAPENLVCLDLRKCVDHINKCLTARNLPEVQIKNLLFDRLEGINLEDVDFKKLEKKLKFDSQLSEHIEPTIKQGEIELKTKHKELADKYLFCGIMYHNEKKHRKATYCFNKAIYHYPNYKIYFYQAKDLRKKISNEEIKQVIADTKANAPLPEENHAVTVVIEKCIEEKINKESPVSLEEQYLNLLAQYDKEEQNQTNNEELINKKLALLKKLIAIYSNKGDYNTSKNFCIKGIELSKQKANEEIWFYFPIIKILYAQKKYTEAKSYCEQTLRLKISIPHTIKLYSFLIELSSHLKEDKNETEKYYRTAKRYLEKIKHNNGVYEKLSDEVEKSWRIALSCIIDQAISSDRELKNNIGALKTSSDLLTNKHQLVEQKINNFEQLIKHQMGILQQQITELRNVLEIKLHQENKKDKSLKEIVLDWIRNKFRF